MKVTGFALAVVGIAASAATLALTSLPESTSLFSFRKNLEAPEALNLDFEFSKWAAEHNKQYDTLEEFAHRLEQFKRNFYQVRALNQMDTGATFSLNHLSDLTEEEYEARLGLGPMPNAYEAPVYLDESSIANGGIDWRGNGKVNAIKNQGGCGSCWAFSAVASMESVHAIKSGQLVRLSEQQVVDCSKSNGGCNGGWYDSAWNDMKNQGGMMTEASYPYTAKNGVCKTGTKVMTPTGYKMVTPNNPDQIKAALSAGPVSIALSAGNAGFQGYKSGIWNGSGCGTRMDHAVVTVGWGNANGVDYFIVRNSWGTGWGESGYMRLQALSGAGACGMNQRPAQVSTN